MKALAMVPPMPRSVAMTPSVGRRRDGGEMKWRATVHEAMVNVASAAKKRPKRRTSRESQERRHILRARQAEAGRPRWKTEMLSATVVVAGRRVRRVAFA